jgi:hypothetical protein
MKLQLVSMSTNERAVVNDFSFPHGAEEAEGLQANRIVSPPLEIHSMEERRSCSIC